MSIVKHWKMYSQTNKISEAGGQRSEVRGQKSEVGSQRSAVRSQRSEVRSQAPDFRPLLNKRFAIKFLEKPAKRMIMNNDLKIS